MRKVAFHPNSLPVFSRRAAFGVAVALVALLVAGPKDAPMAERAEVKAPVKKAVTKKSGASANTGGAAPITKRTLVTLRGEIVDYYCYIEKAARGPEHRDCAVKCVSGDICMGVLTLGDEQLYMISRNHLRAMQPIQFRGIPDPFNSAMGLIADTVDVTGYAMERKGQKIVEIMAVKKAVRGSPIPKPPIH
ncbi:MAG: hypothetical protein ACM3JJ_01230 [Hyphomicrobiales bacterium]